MLYDESVEEGAPRLAIILPCYNEEASIGYAAEHLIYIIGELIADGIISKDSFLFFVDDGSSDNSWEVITGLHQKGNAIKGLKLSKNFGHQAALLAGLMTVTKECDVAISIDADLQQDPCAIKNFIQEFRNGAEVVLGVRRDRSEDGWFKKRSALIFYATMRTFGVNIVPNHADYRLLSKKALEALAQFPEPSIFLRATCLQLGFKTAIVQFDVRERQFGETKYSLKKMLRLALHGITSTSVVPLRIVAVTGFILFILSLGMGGYVIWQALVGGNTVPGWASTTLPIYFIGGVQLLCLGIVGEYIGQIYKTVKNRPRWICEYKLD